MLIKHSVFTSLALSFFTVLCLAHYDFQKPDHEVGYPEPPSYPSEIPSVPPPTYPSEALSMTPPTYPSETLSMAPATYPPMTPPGPPPTKPSTAPSSSSSSCPTPTSPETDPIYLCPGDIEAKYIGQDGSQFDLKFCSNIYRWDPSDLTRSQVCLNFISFP